MCVGCASIPPDVRRIDAAVDALELDATPFFPQDLYECGPAALTTVLTASGADVTLDDIVDKVYLPGRKGSLQAELLAATRTSGRLPYVTDGTLNAIWNELSAGRPVLVLQNLGIAAIPSWHYAVVIGIDPAGDRVILRSGTDRRRSTPIDVFLRTWRRGDYWAMVALRPDELPATVDRAGYFRQIAALEQAGAVTEAGFAWQSALNVWPGDSVALFGLANAQLAAGKPAEAERLYRELLARDARQLAVRNNLAMALARQGRHDEGLDEIAKALAAGPEAALAAELEDTRAQILAMREDPN